MELNIFKNLFVGEGKKQNSKEQLQWNMREFKDAGKLLAALLLGPFYSEGCG